MEKTLEKVYTLYILLFPDGIFYFGSTEDRDDREPNHLNKLKKGKHVNKLLQEHYNKTKQLPEFIELGKGDEYDICCSEHYLVKMFKNHDGCLNIRTPSPPHIQKIRIEEGYDQAVKQYMLDKNKTPEKKQYDKEYNKKYDQDAWRKTPLGKIQSKINGARSNIKKWIKLERWDKVEEWKVILVERLKVREEYHKNKK